ILLIVFSPMEEWINRLIAYSVFIFGLTAVGFWYFLNPKTEMIYKVAKLYDPEKRRNIASIIIRSVGVAFFILFSYEITIPFSVDLAELSKHGQPKIIETRIVNISRTGPARTGWAYRAYNFEGLYRADESY